MNEYAQKQIDAIAEACKRIKPLVAIRCITFNHEPYIRDALEGFVMQKTDFPFVAIVHDDASTDGTAAIIREYAEKYPDIIFPIFETENQYSKRDGSLRQIVDGACFTTEAKYIAMCEGDDYWIDPVKIQKQVDYLESNPIYGMCYTKSNFYNQVLKKYTKYNWGAERTSFEDLLCHAYAISTATIVFKTEIYKKYKEEVTGNWLMGDYPLSLYFSLKSKISLIPQVTSVYRILERSASHFTNITHAIKFQESVTDIRKYYIKLSGLHALNSYIDSIHNLGILEKAYQFNDYNLAKIYSQKNLPSFKKALIFKQFATNKALFTILNFGLNLYHKIR